MRSGGRAWAGVGGGGGGKGGSTFSDMILSQLLERCCARLPARRRGAGVDQEGASRGGRGSGARAPGELSVGAGRGVPRLDAPMVCC